ncbi:iron chelate uptake ABC transporter family permease subunit [Sphingomonas ginkgonis]|uniref:iron chelate uptake ABC transporter family permease subunit n=1 Tax=Sphingomonas ginkgonis TaxID=2315330 RepID=UPI001EEFAF3D|nr:iron chelate uptake ABC transporter family permease subunit [Sphingomonas ginkgonis]
MAVLELCVPLAPLRALARLDPALAREIFVELRLPRALLALGYGAVLGICGAALQALFANPLASPDLTGSSSGAALGAVAASAWLGLTGPLALGFGAATGALLALLLLLALAGRRADPLTMLLAGLAISLAAGAATTLALALAPSPFAFYEAFSWLLGDFADRSLAQAAVLLPAAGACALLLARSRALDRLALGEDVAASLGVRTGRLRREVVVLVAVAVGACVAVGGAVGFIGLVAPVLARRLTRGHPGRALLPAGLLGALLLGLADLLSRLAPLGRSIPPGAITALLGTPLFLWLLVQMRWRLTP